MQQGCDGNAVTCVDVSLGELLVWWLYSVCNAGSAVGYASCRPRFQVRRSEGEMGEMRGLLLLVDGVGIPCSVEVCRVGMKGV